MDAAQKQAIRQGLVDGKKYECFGISWDQKDAICAGGIDYTNGNQPRERCGWFDLCGKERAADLAARPFIPVSSLTRPPAAVMAGPTMAPVRVAPSSLPPAPLAVAPPPTPMQPYQNLAALAARAVATASPAPQQPLYPVQLQPMPVQATHLQYVARDYSMPSFLHEPEPIYEGESVWAALGWELVRGAGKGLFQTGASFFDRYAFRRPRR